MANSECRWQCPEQWSEWGEWLAAGLHARNRWRLPVLLMGILFVGGRRTVTTWLRAAGVSDDFQDYYYCLAGLGRKIESVANRLLALILRTLPLPGRVLLVIDDSPTKRYGPKVEGPTCITIPRRGRPTNRSCMVTCGSRFRLLCVIRSGVRWRCPCGRCSTFARRRWPRFPSSVVGRGSPPNCNWQPDWSSGWLRSSNERAKPCGS